MATSNEKFLNYNGLVKLIGLIKKRINDAVGSIDLSWKTNKFVKSIAGYGTGAAPASTSGVNDTKNKLEGTYTTGCLDGTGTDVTTNKFTYIDTTYGGASTSKAGLMSSADKTKLNGVDTGAQVNVIEHVRLAGENADLAVTDKRVTIPNATTAAGGLLSAADKQKLDSVADGAINGITYNEVSASVYEGVADLTDIVNQLTLENLPSDDESWDNLGQELWATYLPKTTKSGDIGLTSNISVDGSSKSDVQSALVALNTLAASNKSAIATIQSAGLTREVVTELPTGSNIKTNVIYMILASNDTMNSGDPSTGATTTPFSANSNSYNEYMYINSAWERIGSTEVNLDIDPITNDEIDTAWSTTAAAA